MTKAFKGIDYDYEIISEKLDEDYGFSIKAKHKTSGRYSHITTVNYVLSELGVEFVDEEGYDNPKYMDTTFYVSKKESEKLFKIATDLFANARFYPYLEKQLYDDRDAGEWENFGK